MNKIFTITMDFAININAKISLYNVKGPKPAPNPDPDPLDNDEFD